MGRVQFLDWELLHVAGLAKKKEKKRICFINLAWSQELESVMFSWSFFFFSCLEAYIPHSIWSSWARDQIWGTVVTYLAAAAVLDPLTHCAGPGIKPASWSCRDAIDPVAPQEKLHFPALKIIIIDLRELDVWVYSFLFTLITMEMVLDIWILLCFF